MRSPAAVPVSVSLPGVPFRSLAHEPGRGPGVGPGGAVPVPVRPTVCGEPPAFEAIDTEAARAPVPVGVNVTPTAQVAGEARFAPLHVFEVIANCVASAPVSVTLDGRSRG